MALTKQQKKNIIKKHSDNEANTGLAETQIAILTSEINNLSEHLKNNKKDFSSKRGLFKKVSLRKSLLNNLEKKDIERYRKIVKELKLRN